MYLQMELFCLNRPNQSSIYKFMHYLLQEVLVINNLINFFTFNHQIGYQTQ